MNCVWRGREVVYQNKLYTVEHTFTRYVGFEIAGSPTRRDEDRRAMMGMVAGCEYVEECEEG